MRTKSLPINAVYMLKEQIHTIFRIQCGYLCNRGTKAKDPEIYFLSPKRMRGLYNEDLYNLHPSPNVVRVIKSTK